MMYIKFPKSNMISACFNDGVNIGFIRLSPRWYIIFLILCSKFEKLLYFCNFLVFFEWNFLAMFFSGVRVTRSLVWCVCFVDRFLSFCPFSLGHCVVCPFSIYRFWLPLWYRQTLLANWVWIEESWSILYSINTGMMVKMFSLLSIVHSH